MKVCIFLDIVSGTRQSSFQFINLNEIFSSQNNDSRTSYDAAEINEWYNGFIEVRFSQKEERERKT